MKFDLKSYEVWQFKYLEIEYFLKIEVFESLKFRI